MSWPALIGVLIFFFGVMGSIALHEVGHLVPAKRFGVRVTQYMVGFGPTVWSKVRGETEYGFKAIPLGGTRRLQLRVELYNAFDTDQWTGVNTNATFDYTTGALTNANTFGRLNGNTNSARRIQLGARFTF